MFRAQLTFCEGSCPVIHEASAEIRYRALMNFLDSIHQ